MAIRSKPKPDIERRTIDGRTIILHAVDVQRFAGSAICIGGDAWGCHDHEPHKFRTPTTYDDYTRDLRGIHLTKEESKKCYRCRSCNRFMGCRRCSGEPENLVCSYCHDWANDISEQVHGKMIKDKEILRLGLKLVMMRSEGKLDQPGFEKLWADALAGSRKWNGPDFSSMTPQEMVKVLSEKMDMNKKDHR